MKNSKPTTAFESFCLFCSVIYVDRDHKGGIHTDVQDQIRNKGSGGQDQNQDQDRNGKLWDLCEGSSSTNHDQSFSWGPCCGRRPSSLVNTIGSVQGPVKQHLAGFNSSQQNRRWPQLLSVSMFFPTTPALRPRQHHGYDIWYGPWIIKR